jgi:low affinity Fe/Cu permease
MIKTTEPSNGHISSNGMPPCDLIFKSDFMKLKKQIKPGFPERFASAVTRVTGSTGAFIIALMAVIIWAAAGPVFHYSENWQLVINTGTTIITFLMVFLIQKAQNKDSLAIQLKLNELVAAHAFASNRLVNVENLSEEELKIIQQYYSTLSNLTKKDETLQKSHSIDEANQYDDMKKHIEDRIKEKLKSKK